MHGPRDRGPGPRAESAGTTRFHVKIPSYRPLRGRLPFGRIHYSRRTNRRRRPLQRRVLLRPNWVTFAEWGSYRRWSDYVGSCSLVPQAAPGRCDERAVPSREVKPKTVKTACGAAESLPVKQGGRGAQRQSQSHSFRRQYRYEGRGCVAIGGAVG